MSLSPAAPTGRDGVTGSPAGRMTSRPNSPRPAAAGVYVAGVILASAAAWAVLVTAIPPADQNFPLNDDWAFARGAFAFARGAGIHYFHWASMPQLGQWLWAAPFLWVLGESHFALRAATVCLGWVGLWAFYDLLRQEGWAARPAALAAAALTFNPLFFLLQGTFLTDMPALSLALLALALYGRAARGTPAWLWAAAGVGVLAAVTRQNTVVLVAATAALLLRSPGRWREPAWAWALGAPLAAGVAAHLWLDARLDVRHLHPEPPTAAAVGLITFLVVHTSGLAALPVLAGVPRAASWKWGVAALAVLSGGAVYWYHHAKQLPYGGLFPYSENMLSPWGAFHGSRFTGPLMPGDRPVLLGLPARLLLSALGCMGGAAWVARVAASRRPGPLPLFAALQLPFILIAPDLYDRYLLFLMPGALALCSPPDREVGRRTAAGLVVVAAFAVASVALMHDWLAWNSARWELGQRALDQGIDPHDVEGGFEWDGSFAPEQPARRRATPAPGNTLPFTRRVFPHVTGRWALAFSVPPGTVAVASAPYRQWLVPGPHEFFLVRVVPPAPAPSAR